MLDSKKLKSALFLFLCLISQNLFAADLRFYLILQAGGGASYDYIGSVTIDDDVQALAAQIFFPDGQVVNINMDILGDGVTVNLQVNPNAHTYVIASSPAPLMSSFSKALQAGSGNPSGWLAIPIPTSYRFQLPEISHGRQVELDKQASNYAEGVRIRFNKRFPAEIRSMNYSIGVLSLNPGQRTSGRQSGVVDEMTDQYLFQLFDLMIVALISPQLVRGWHFSSRSKRDAADPKQKLPLEIHTSQRCGNNAEASPGYMLWTWEGFGWMQQYVAEALPQGVPSSPQGSYGTINTLQGPKICFIMPMANPVGPSVDPTVAHLLEQFGGMSLGEPPHYCRSGSHHWRGGDGFGGGPGPGWGGGGAGGFTAH